jgi:hypothetical protein
MDPTGTWLIVGGDEMVNLASDTVTATTGLQGETTIDSAGAYAYISISGCETVAVFDLVGMAEVDVDANPGTTDTCGAFPAPAGVTRIDLNFTAGASNPIEIVTDPAVAQAYVVLRGLTPDKIAYIDTAANAEIDLDNDGGTTDGGALLGISRITPNNLAAVYQWIVADSTSAIYAIDNNADLLTIFDATPPVPMPQSPVIDIRIGADPVGVDVTP